jgi:hypothetical protein
VKFKIQLTVLQEAVDRRTVFEWLILVPFALRATLKEYATDCSKGIYYGYFKGICGLISLWHKLFLLSVSKNRVF